MLRSCFRANILRLGPPLAVLGPPLSKLLDQKLHFCILLLFSTYHWHMYWCHVWVHSLVKSRPLVPSHSRVDSANNICKSNLFAWNVLNFKIICLYCKQYPFVDWLMYLIKIFFKWTDDLICIQIFCQSVVVVFQIPKHYYKNFSLNFGIPHFG